jgi:hypothetical protein
MLAGQKRKMAVTTSSDSRSNTPAMHTSGTATKHLVIGFMPLSVAPVVAERQEA